MIVYLYRRYPPLGHSITPPQWRDRCCVLPKAGGCPEVAEVFVGRNQDGRGFVREIQNLTVVDAGRHLGDIENVMALGTKSVDDFTFYSFVGKKVHFVGVDSG